MRSAPLFLGGARPAAYGGALAYKIASAIASLCLCAFLPSALAMIKEYIDSILIKLHSHYQIGLFKLPNTILQ